ncbi:MAG TPA: DUF6352 family protein [Casimicrobiaceae bacterium]|nr:DUF6352 family protein [Casimicrobiaceae bacterium]
MPDFWPSCGYALLGATPAGRLAVGDAFLKSFLARPELSPVPESCAAERALHVKLLEDPRRGIREAEVDALADPDARENYRIWLRFRNRLLDAPDLESAYLALFRGQGVDVPPLFVHQLTQILLRHILGESAAPMQVRAAEMLFRAQKVSVLGDGAVMAADLETVDRLADTGAFGSLGELLAQNRTPTRTIELDVLSEDNAKAYWDRDERHDFALSLNRGAGALEALCRVLERWIGHFLAVDVSIHPRSEVDDARWVWHVGLDAEASALLNDLYNRIDVGEDRRERLLCLFELTFAKASDMRPSIAGRPVYLAMAMDGDHRLRLKPQNLLLNLPLARPQ